MPDQQYSIEARSLRVVGVASHNYWVLRAPDGTAMAELHGLATDRGTGRAVPIGTDERRHSLRIWHLAHDRELAAESGDTPTRESYIRQGQQFHTVITGNREEVLARWSAGVAAREPLNELDLDYPNHGFKMFGDTVNSNSAYRTLGEVMGVPVRGFGGVIEPGIGNRMTSPEEIEKLRTKAYPPLASCEARENEGSQAHGLPSAVDVLLLAARDGEAALGDAMRDLQASTQGQSFAERAQARAQALDASLQVRPEIVRG